MTYYLKFSSGRWLPIFKPPCLAFQSLLLKSIIKDGESRIDMLNHLTYSGISEVVSLTFKELNVSLYNQYQHLLMALYDRQRPDSPEIPDTFFSGTCQTWLLSGPQRPTFQLIAC